MPIVISSTPGEGSAFWGPLETLRTDTGKVYEEVSTDSAFGHMQTQPVFSPPLFPQKPEVLRDPWFKQKD